MKHRHLLQLLGPCKQQHHARLQGSGPAELARSLLGLIRDIYRQEYIETEPQ